MSRYHYSFCPSKEQRQSRGNMNDERLFRTHGRKNSCQSCAAARKKVAKKPPTTVTEKFKHELQPRGPVYQFSQVQTEFQ